MKKLTNTEKKIVQFITKLNSIGKLKNALEDFVYDGMSSEIPVVRDAYKLLSLSPSENIDVQYLNYSINNYQKINNKDFSSPIERVSDYSYLAPAVETEIIRVDYHVGFVTLPSMIEQQISDVEEHFWEYDPEREIVDYLETEIDSIDFNNADVSINEYFKGNVIE